MTEVVPTAVVDEHGDASPHRASMGDQVAALAVAGGWDAGSADVGAASSEPAR